jgi:hypothetical protein
MRAFVGGLIVSTVVLGSGLPPAAGQTGGAVEYPGGGFRTLQEALDAVPDCNAIASQLQPPPPVGGLE